MILSPEDPPPAEDLVVEDPLAEDPVVDQPGDTTKTPSFCGDFPKHPKRTGFAGRCQSHLRNQKYDLFSGSSNSFATVVRP